MLNSGEMQARTAPETPAEIFARVFREIKPRSRPPAIRVEFRRFANVNATIRLDPNELRARISDLLEGAPAPVFEALAWILLAKLFRQPVARAWTHRYRQYLNRGDMRRRMHVVRQIRGRKFVSGPEGAHYRLDEIFEELNRRFFNGLLGCPRLGWSRQRSRNMLGHFDASHNAIIISRIFDDAKAPRLALEYVLFHEMLHLRFPVEHRGARRRVHTREFREAEKRFPQLKEARELLRTFQDGSAATIRAYAAAPSG